MYFKVEKGVPLWDKLEELRKKILHVRTQAFSLTQELGFSKYGQAHNVLAGGISCIYSEVKPDGYRQVGEKYRNLYFPKASNKEVTTKIANLPIVSYDEYNDVISFTEQFTELSWVYCYGLKKSGDVFVIKINENACYTPVDGMVEIVASEYKMWVDSIGEPKSDDDGSE